jgi:hypothetical protein
MRRSRLILGSIAVLVAALAIPACGGDGNGEEPCQPTPDAAPNAVLKQLEAMNARLDRAIAEEEAKEPGAPELTVFIHEENKRDLMALFRPVYAVKWEQVYNSLREVDDDLDKARKAHKAKKDPTESLKRAKLFKDGLLKSFKEAGIPIPKAVTDQFAAMNAKIDEAIEKKGGDPEADLIFALGEEKRKLMSTFPPVHDVPFPDVYYLLKDLDLALAKAEGAKSKAGKVTLLERAKRKKEELEMKFRKGACR